MANNLSADVRGILDRLTQIRSEEAALEEQLQELRELLGVGASTSQQRPARRRLGSTRSAKGRPIQANSSVDWAKRILQHERQPLQVEQLISLIHINGGPLIKKPTLVSNLSRYVKQGDTFSRTGRNTYGLAEWEKSADELDELFGADDVGP